MDITHGTRKGYAQETGQGLEHCHPCRVAHNKYMREYQKRRYRKRMDLAIEKLGGNCAVCSTKEDLHIDHIDPDTKAFDPSAQTQYSLDRWLKELEKCQLLCRQHHEDKTLKENKKRIPWNKGTASHGTYHMRYNLKCKCDKCISFSDERNKRRRKN